MRFLRRPLSRGFTSTTLRRVVSRKLNWHSSVIFFRPT